MQLDGTVSKPRNKSNEVKSSGSPRIVFVADFDSLTHTWRLALCTLDFIVECFKILSQRA
jgi:hypothetical protein